MDAPLKPIVVDTSLATVLAALAAHEDKALVIDYGDGRQVQA
jgi:uncharacterized protein (DUF1786 family)